MLKKRELDPSEKPFLIMWAILAVIHLFLPLQWADDAVFRRMVASGYRVFIANTARPISDTVTYLFSCYPILWRLLNPIVLTGFARTLTRLIPIRPENRRSVTIFICCACVYPCMIVVDAGFIATTVNYLWPGLCGLLTVKFLQDSIKNRKIPFWQYIVSIPLTMYATNMQQLGVTIFLFFAATSVILLYKKQRLNFYLFFELLLYLLGILFAFYINVFGESSRMALETRYFPTFLDLNILQKAELGISSTLFNLIMHPHFSYGAFLAFLVVLGVCITRTPVNSNKKCIIWLAVAEVVIFGILRYIPGYSLGYQTYLMNQAEYRFCIWPYFFYLLFFALFFYALYFHLGKQKFLQALFLLGLGMLSRMIMGFSPTVWASGQRTFFILFIMLIIVAAMAIDTGTTKQKQEQSNKENANTTPVC